MAYERAASAIENAPPVADLIAAGELQKLGGVGKTIAGRIEELALTGRSAYFDELAAKYPPTLIELLGVQGVGVKTAAALFEQHGIASLEDLERALDSGMLSGTARLGKKSLENMKRGLLAYRGRQRRTPIGRALPLAREIVAYLASGPAKAGDFAYAGSLRRAEVTVGDIDIVCTSDDPDGVIRHFTAWDRAEAVLAEGSTKASIWLAGGLQIDLRVLPFHLYGNLLQHFTGSREHNIQLRELAVRKGLRVSENGILDLASGENLTCRTEEEVYSAIGLAYVPPEMRQGTGEIEAAIDGSLPIPLAQDDLRGDFHMHSTWSDGKNALEEMVASAARLGYAYHSISDHSWGRSMGLDPERLRAQHAEAKALGERYGVRTLCSSEVDIREDGSLDYDPGVLAELDIVLASVHDALGIGREAMTRRLIRACENPFVTIIGHPTGRSVQAYDGYEFDYDAVFAAAARTGTALEIDGQPERLDLPSALARRARQFGVTFTVDSDAHSTEQLGNVSYAIGQARRAWITKQEVLNARPLEDVLAFVAEKRARS